MEELLWTSLFTSGALMCSMVVLNWVLGREMARHKVFTLVWVCTLFLSLVVMAALALVNLGYSLATL